MSRKDREITLKPVSKDLVPEKIETVVYPPKFKGSQFLIFLTYGGKRPERRMWIEGRTSRGEINYLADMLKGIYNPDYLWGYGDNMKIDPFTNVPKYYYKVNMQVRERPPYSIRGLQACNIMYAGLMGICIWAVMLACGVRMDFFGTFTPEFRIFDHTFKEAHVPGYGIPIISFVIFVLGAIFGRRQLKRGYNTFVYGGDSGPAELLILFYVLISIWGLSVLISEAATPSSITHEWREDLLETTVGWLSVLGGGFTAFLLLMAIAANWDVISVMHNALKLHDAAVKRKDPALKKDYRTRVSYIPEGRRSKDPEPYVIYV